jgi:hypothetical protein
LERRSQFITAAGYKARSLIDLHPGIGCHLRCRFEYDLTLDAHLPGHHQALRQVAAFS